MLSAKDYLMFGQTIIPNIILENYTKLSLTDAEFIVLMQLYLFLQKGISFPAPEEIANQTGKKVEEIYKIISTLQEKEIIALKTYTDDKKMRYDQYDLSPLLEKVEKYLTEKENHLEDLMKQKKTQELYEVFQQEYGKPLSSMQLEILGQWLEIDHYDPEIIRLALKEAVLNQVYSMRYIDSILLSWSREKLDTKEKVMAAQKKRKSNFVRKDDTENLPKIPWVDWIKGEE